MGQQNTVYNDAMLDVVPQQVHHHPEPCMVSYGGVTCFPQPYRTRTILPPPGNFDPRYLPENHGHMPYVIPQYYGEHCNTLMVPSPSGGLFLVPFNEDQLPFLNHQIFERSRSLFMDGSNGEYKRSSSSSVMDERNRAASAMGYDPAVVYNNSHLIHGGQSIQAVPTPWLDQHGATGAFSCNCVHCVPYLQGCMNGCGMEAANTGLHGYQVTSISRNSMSFMHPPPIRPHPGPQIVYYPPPLPPPPPPPQPSPRPQVQAQNMDIHLQLASTSHTYSTSTSTSNPFQDGVELGPRFVGTIPQPGFRIYEAHRQELMIDSTLRHRFPHLRGFLSEDELVALGEEIDSVDSGLSDSFISDYLKTKAFALCRPSHAEHLVLADEEPNICVICQMEFEDQEKIGMLDCWHEYHAECIKKWLIVKNNCPICKSTALA